MDLMEEHNIKQLKKLAEHCDATFSGEFFKDVIAMNICALLKANETIREAVHLGHQGVHIVRKKRWAPKSDLPTPWRNVSFTNTVLVDILDMKRRMTLTKVMRCWKIVRSEDL